MTTLKLQIHNPHTLQKILAYVAQFEDIELQTEQEDLHDSYKMSISTLAKDWDTEADQRWDNYEDYECQTLFWDYSRLMQDL